MEYPRALLNAAVLAVALVVPSAVLAAAPARPPNVVLVIIDDARADRFGAYGAGPKATPAFDALAREGVLFDAAFSQAGWTLPSVSSIMTGLYPSVHGVVRALPADWPARLARGRLRPEPGSHLHDSRMTLAEALRARGYRTAAVVSCPFGDPMFGFAQGFEDYLNLGGSFRDVDREVARRLDALQGGPPFFLYVHAMDAHTSHEGGEEVDGGGASARRAFAADYARKVSAADGGLGELVGLLRARGLLDTSILAVTADHGESLWEHGVGGHGGSPYAEALRVPLLLRAPGLKPGRSSVPAQTIDLFPTFLDLAGLAPQDGVEGSSLRAALEGRAEAGRAAWSEVYPHTPAFNDRVSAVVARTADRAAVWRPDGSLELFDRRRDPGETKDLAGERPEEAASWRARVEAWRAERSRAAAALPPVPGTEKALPPDEAERLRKAGYLK